MKIKTSAPAEVAQGLMFLLHPSIAHLGKDARRAPAVLH
jgi:hypothetical protein